MKPYLKPDTHFLYNGVLYRSSKTFGCIEVRYDDIDEDIIDLPPEDEIIIGTTCHEVPGAVVYVNRDGRLHRNDGAAVIYYTGTEEWWANGVEITDPLTILLMQHQLHFTENAL